MKTNLLYLFTRTPLHVGAGSSVGAVDQPVQRERHTGFPIIPGSSIKGVLRDFFETNEVQEQESLRLFGKADNNGDSRSGIVSFGEARLLLFPVRSAKGSFALATCPLALSRWKRDFQSSLTLPEEPNDMNCLAGDTVNLSNKAVLEEYAFNITGNFPADWANDLSNVIDDEVLKAAKTRFVLLSNGDFAHFVMNTCPVNQHVSINDETGTAVKEALFNEETVPSESLFYSPVTSQPLNNSDEDKVCINHFIDKLSKETLMQFGGNSTSGLGFTTTLLK